MGAPPTSARFGGANAGKEVASSPAFALLGWRGVGGASALPLACHRLQFRSSVDNDGSVQNLVIGMVYWQLEPRAFDSLSSVSLFGHQVVPLFAAHLDGR